MERLKIVLESIANQDRDTPATVVINGDPDDSVAQLASGHGFSVVVESKIGVAHARHRSFQIAHDDELLIFVDDDNELAPEYVSNALSAAETHREWGAFSGLATLPDRWSGNPRTRALLPYLAVRDLGPETLESEASLEWNPIEPFGAGVCLRPELVAHLRNALSDPTHPYFRLGRSGGSLMSGEDAYIVRSCVHVGLKWGYDPSLRLVHHIAESRTSIRYLARLMYGYGRSDVRLAEALNRAPAYPLATTRRSALSHYIWHAKRHDGGWISGLRFLGQYSEGRRCHPMS